MLVSKSAYAFSHSPVRPLSSSVFGQCLKKWNINLDEVVTERLEELQAYLYDERGLLNPLESFRGGSFASLTNF
jgi:hypothetical protein